VATHPLNLTARFLLELSALLVLGLWGWHQREDGLRVAIALAVPFTCAAFWGTFAVPGDPTRSGSAPVPVPGALRLALELGFFAWATLALHQLGFHVMAWTFAAAVGLHYALSYDRLQWLVVQPRRR
jgi:hypothetical protein